MPLRLRTLLLATVVGGVAATAAVAALRGGDAAGPQPARAAASAVDAPARVFDDAPLAARADASEDAPPAGALAGRLLVSTGCRLLEIDLATLAQVDRGTSCWIVASPGGRYLLTAAGPRQEAGALAPPGLRVLDRATGEERTLPGACGSLVLPAVDDAGTVYTCSDRSRPVRIARTGATRRIPAGVAVLPLDDGALIVSRGRLLALDGTDVLPAAPDASLFAHARDGTLGVVEAPTGAPARLRTYKDGAPVADVPVELVGGGVPNGSTFTLSSGSRAAWLPLLITRRGAVVQPAHADAAVPDELQDWPAALAPDDGWVAIARDRAIILADLDPVTPRYALRFDDPIGSLAWVP